MNGLYPDAQSMCKKELPCDRPPSWHPGGDVKDPWPKKVGIVVPVAFSCWTLLPKGPARSSPDSTPKCPGTPGPSSWGHWRWPDQIPGQDCSGISYPQRLSKFRVKPCHSLMFQTEHGHPNQYQSASIVSKVCSSARVGHCLVSHDQAKKVLLWSGICWGCSRPQGGYRRGSLTKTAVYSLQLPPQ